MGNKNNTAAKKPANNSLKGVQAERLDGTKIFLIVFAIIALVGIVFALVFGIVSYLRNQPVDYMKANLGKYIELSDEDYKNYEALINLDKVTDMTVENEIIKLLYKNRKETDNKNRVDQTIKVGDTANIYYYGYTLDENGNKLAFDGGCNFGSGVTALGIGSGSMIPGFELALVGKNSADYSKLTNRTDGVVEEGNMVYITYTATYYDGGFEKDKTMLVDLSGDVDAKYGQGFKAFLLGAKVGEKISGSVVTDKYTAEGVKHSDTYSNVTVNSVIEFSEGEPLTIDVSFPRPYTSAPELSGKAVKFDVYIATSVSYDTPEFNDEFITETLKVTADDLADYKGDTLVDKYRASLKAKLEATYEENVNSAIEEAFWANVREKLVVKRLPKADVDTFYRQYYNELNTYYASYSSYYSSFDQAARAYLGISSSEDWQTALVTKAEDAVKEKLAFYYIAREADLIPTGETYDKLYAEMYNEMLDAYLEQYNVVREDFDTEEEYEKKVQEYRDMIDVQYGEDYIRESVYFEHVMEALRAYATVKHAQ